MVAVASLARKTSVPRAAILTEQFRTHNEGAGGIVRSTYGSNKGLQLATCVASRKSPPRRADGGGGVRCWCRSIGASTGGCLCSHSCTPVVEIAVLRVGYSTVCTCGWLGGISCGVGIGMDVIFGKGVGSRASVVWTMESAVGAVSCGDGVVVGVCAASCVGEVGEHPAAGISAFAELLDVVGVVVAGVYCEGAGGGAVGGGDGLEVLWWDCSSGVCMTAAGALLRSSVVVGESVLECVAL